MSRYKKLHDGEARLLPGHRWKFPHKIRCCDCSLTHFILLEITSPRTAKFTAWRDKRATAASRRK